MKKILECVLALCVVMTSFGCESAVAFRNADSVRALTERSNVTGIWFEQLRELRGEGLSSAVVGLLYVHRPDRARDLLEKTWWTSARCVVVVRSRRELEVATRNFGIDAGSIQWFRASNNGLWVFDPMSYPDGVDSLVANPDGVDEVPIADETVGVNESSAVTVLPDLPDGSRVALVKMWQRSSSIMAVRSTDSWISLAVANNKAAKALDVVSDSPRLYWMRWDGAKLEMTTHNAWKRPN